MSFDVTVPCPCPGSPHPDGDTISLREKLGLSAGISIQRMIIDANRDGAEPEMAGKLAEGYLLYGVESWSLVDELEHSVPVNEDTIRLRLLSDFAVSSPVADAADELYMAAVILPLVKRAQTSSPSTPTNGSTSQPRSGTSKRQKPSRPSSTTTTPTASTRRTSSELAGVSR